MREQSALFLACVAVAITRIAALSRSMCDWDEALFCLGVRDYDVPAYRPHPPGFPLFVGAAKLLRPIAAGTTSDVYAVDLTTGARAPASKASSRSSTRTRATVSCSGTSYC